MKALMRLALRLYPTAWRRRYGLEIRQLIDDGRATPADLVDLIARAPLATTLRGEVTTMNRHLAADPLRLAFLALAITLPTAVFVGVAVLKYIVGVPGPFDAIEPGVTPFITHPIGETIVVLAPYVALVLALLPFARLRVGRREGRIAMSADLAVPLANLAIAALSGTLIVFMGAYWIAENF